MKHSKVSRIFKIIFIYLLSLILSTSSLSAEEFVLSQTKIGRLILTPNSPISVKIIKKAFPEYSVTHEIRSGDSPDFHWIGISNKEKELLFYIVSYLEEPDNKNTNLYNIDLLTVTSPHIKDEHGIKVGDYLDKVIKSRGENLLLSANHFDNSIGNSNLFYQFTVKPSEKLRSLGLDYFNPENVTLKQVIESNPIITSISWPNPRWE